MWPSGCSSCAPAAIRTRVCSDDEPSPSSLRDATSPERERFYGADRKMNKSSPFGGAGTPSGVTERVAVPLGKVDCREAARRKGYPHKKHRFPLRKAVLFQPFSARLWKTRCSFSSSYWWEPCPSGRPCTAAALREWSRCRRPADGSPGKRSAYAEVPRRCCSGCGPDRSCHPCP